MTRRTLRLTGAALIAAVAEVAACSHTDATGPSAVASLRFVAEPAGVAAGSAFTVTVELLGPDGIRATGARDQVTLSASDSSALVGSTAVLASSGTATFRDIRMTRAGAGIFLTAETATQRANSTSFDVSAGPPSAAHSTATTSVTVIAPGDPTPVSFAFGDAYDNPLGNATVSLASSLAGATFTPSSGTTKSDGTFSSTFRSPAGGNAFVTATVGGAQVTIAAPLPVCLNPTLTLSSPGAGVLTTSSCVISGRPTDFYRFTTSTTGDAAFAITSVFAPRIEVRADPPSESPWALPPQAQAAHWLLPAGNYEFRLSANSGSGAYSFTSAFGAGATGCVTRYLAVGGVYTGQTLASGDCTDYPDAFTDKFVVFGNAPCSVRVHSTQFTNYIFIYDHASQAFLTGTTGFDVGVDALIGLPACKNANQPLEVWVVNDVGEPGGSYALTVNLNAAPSLRAEVQDSATAAHRAAALARAAQRRLTTRR